MKFTALRIEAYEQHIVTIECDGEFNGGYLTFLEKLKQAIAQWQQTPNGGEQLELACGDFNYSDLWENHLDEELVAILNANGIVNLRMSIYHFEGEEIGLDTLLDRCASQA